MSDTQLSLQYKPLGCRLLLRVHSGSNLVRVSTQGTYCKVYVGDNSMKRGSRKSFKRILGRSSSGAEAGDSSLRVYKTPIQKNDENRSNPVWNTKFDIPVCNPNTELLTIRVKSVRMVTSVSIGTCSLSLRELKDATVDRWFSLEDDRKNPIGGKVRLQMRLVYQSMRGLSLGSSVEMLHNSIISAASDEETNEYIKDQDSSYTTAVYSDTEVASELSGMHFDTQQHNLALGYSNYSRISQTIKWFPTSKSSMLRARSSVDLRAENIISSEHRNSLPFLREPLPTSHFMRTSQGNSGHNLSVEARTNSTDLVGPQSPIDRKSSNRTTTTSRSTSVHSNSSYEQSPVDTVDETDACSNSDEEPEECDETKLKPEKTTSLSLVSKFRCASDPWDSSSEESHMFAVVDDHNNASDDSESENDDFDDEMLDPATRAAIEADNRRASLAATLALLLSRESSNALMDDDENCSDSDADDHIIGHSHNESLPLIEFKDMTCIADVDYK